MQSRSLLALSLGREFSKRVPLYPLTPIIFCVASAYMLWSSIAYTGTGGVVGIVVLIVGAAVMLLHEASKLGPQRRKE